MVLSGDPAATSGMHGVEARPRSPGDVWKALADARLLISGGGSLVQDVTSARSAAYYLGTMLAASVRGVPVAVVGQGVGPIRRPWVRRLAARAFDRASSISVRDRESARTLLRIGVSRIVHQGADLAVLTPAARPERVSALLAQAGLDGIGPRIGVSIRPWPALPDAGSLGRVIGEFARDRGAAVAVLVFDRVRDRAISDALASSSGGKVVAAESPQDLLGVVGVLDLVVGVRLHALIFAAAVGTPAIGLAYDPKVSAFMSERGLSSVLPVDAPTEALAETLGRTWETRAELRAHLLGALPDLKRAAASGVAEVSRLLSSAHAPL